MNFRKRFRRHSGEPLLDLGTLADGRQLSIPFSAFWRGGLVVGPTGGGKTRWLELVNLQVAEKFPEACDIVISPKGDFAPNFRRECYRRGWKRRVTYIDFSERRRLPGLNVIRAWGSDHLQAKIQREVLARSMGIYDLSETPRLARYSFTGLYAAIASRLTMREAALVLDHADGGVRQAVIERLPECSARRDLVWLEAMGERMGQAGAARFFEEQVGSTLNRLRLLTENPVLRLMLGSQRSLEWETLLAPGRIVVVNADQGTSLDREDQRYLVMSMVADIARTCFSRPPEQRVRVLLTLDEAGWFASGVLQDILDRGREFQLSLLGAVQYPSQLINPRTGDRQVLDSFLVDATLKVVFGGLPPNDAHEMAALMYEHHLDPDKRQLELSTLRQLQKVVNARSVGRGTSWSRSRSFGYTHIWAEGEGEAESETHAHASSVNDGTTELESDSLATGSFVGGTTSQAVLPDGGDIGLTVSATDGVSHLSGTVRTVADVHTEGETDIDGVGKTKSHSKSEAEAESEVEGEAEGGSRSVTVGPMVQPTEPFRELSSVTFEPLQTQLHRLQADMIRQPKQHAVVAMDKEAPVAIRVADVPDPTLTERQALVLDLDMMDAHSFFSTAEEIEAEVEERHRALVKVEAIEAVNTMSAIERRRAVRRAARPIEDSDDAYSAGVVALLPRRRLRRGRSSELVPASVGG